MCSPIRDEEEQMKFLNSNWTALKIENWNAAESFSLMDLIKCFETFTKDCSVELNYFSVNPLLCTNVKIVPKEKKRTRSNPSRKPKSKAKKAKLSVKPKAADVTDHEMDYDTDPGALNIQDLLNFKRIHSKICIDPLLDILYISGYPSTTVTNFFTKVLGLDEIELGKFTLLGKFKGDPRNYCQMRMQRGTSMDKVSSHQTLVEHEQIEAMKLRDGYHCDDVALGAVTKTVGAIPQNFPRITTVHPLIKNVPIRLPKKNYHLGLTDFETKQLAGQLSLHRIDMLSIELDSPSIFHLYHNNSIEKMGGVEPKKPDPQTILQLASDDTKDMNRFLVPDIRRKKRNVAGTVTRGPPFIHLVRARGLFEPVQEYHDDY